MPTYEYECSSCGHTFERFQGIKDDVLKRCPRCRHKVKRLFGIGAGIIFKGSGFYETDYKRSGRRHGGDGEVAASSSSGDAKKAEKSDSSGSGTPAKKGAD